MAVDLDTVVAALDDLFSLDTAEPDSSMSRHIPRVFDAAGIDWRAFVEPLYAKRFNGLVRRGRSSVGTVFGACFPSAQVLDAWLEMARPGDLLTTHHPIDARCGSPEGDVWAEGFVPIAAVDPQKRRFSRAEPTMIPPRPVPAIHMQRHYASLAQLL